MLGVIQAQTIKIPDGTFGYIRIHSFISSLILNFFSEFIRLAELLQHNGLLVDAYNNGDGMIHASDWLLQVLTPHKIKLIQLSLLELLLTYKLCGLHSQDFGLFTWVESIKLIVEIGPTFSQSFPITPEEGYNSISQKNMGSVIRITITMLWCYGYHCR